MKNDIAIAMASKMVDFLTEATGKDASNFEIRNIDEDPNHKAFTIEFIAYNFYWIGIDYERGRITPYIITGSNIIKLKDLSDWWEDMDLGLWTDKLMEEIRFRIPDKYLKKENQNREKVMLTINQIDQSIRKNIFRGVKTPHVTSYPVIRKENGTYYLAVFVFYFTYQDVENGIFNRPTLWAIADIETGEIIEIRETKNIEFSNASHNKKYGILSDSSSNGSKQYYKEAFAVLDSARESIIKNNEFIQNQYQHYLDMILAVTPENFRQFYTDLSI